MLDYEQIKGDYESFEKPVVMVQVGGKDIDADKNGFAISNIHVENTSGFEASVADFTVYNTFDPVGKVFKFDKVKKYVLIGSPVIISMGYGKKVREVFRGFISAVNFVYRRDEIPGIEVHAMDVKGIMMANCYVKQLKAASYSEAVNEILKQSFYQKLKGSDNVFEKIDVADTPDKKEGGGGQQEATDQTIEMVAESDYEFVVRAAKRFNYEFFQSSDTIIFRKAKSDTESLIELSPETGLISFEIGYDVTGLVGSVEVRNTDPGKAKLVKSAQKLKNKMSTGNKAKQLVTKQTKVYIDPTAASVKDAELRAQYLLEDMSYRFGTLEADILGLPEMIPGKFIEVKGLGNPVSNKFYVSSVTHFMEAESFYYTHISGKASTLT